VWSGVVSALVMGTAVFVLARWIREGEDCEKIQKSASP